MIKDYIILDLETTGFSQNFDEIIEISILKIENDEIVDKFVSLVKPKNEINSFVENLTGIKNDMVGNAPIIDDLKGKIINFIENETIIGHNIKFDIGFLENSLNTEIQNEYIDTLFLSKKIFPNFKNHKLKTLAECLKIDLKESHRAYDDCLTNFSLFLKIKEKMELENIDFEDLKKTKKQKKITSFEISDINSIDESNFFYKTTCCFTGKLEKFTRSEISQKIVDIGGYITNDVTKKTDFLILGNSDYFSSLKGDISSKHKKALQLIESGHHIKIFDEKTFLNLFFK